MNTNSTSAQLSSAARDAGSQLRSAAADSAQQLSEAAAAESTRLSEAARDWMHRQQEMASHAAHAVKSEAAALADRSQRYVRDEPMKSVFVAAAAGALITVVLMALRDRR